MVEASADRLAYMSLHGQLAIRNVRVPQSFLWYTERRNCSMVDMIDTRELFHYVRNLASEVP